MNLQITIKSILHIQARSGHMEDKDIMTLYEKIYTLLREYSTLTHTQQQILLYCIKYRIHSISRCDGSISRISSGVGVHRNTTRNALRAISNNIILSRVVIYNNI